jgi:hypothetical protein
VTRESAWEELNLRAPVYQTGAWTSSATGGSKEERVRLELTRPCRAGRFSGPRLHPARSAPKSGGADLNRRLGGHSPALCRLSYAPGRSEEGSNLRGRDRAVAGLAPRCLTTRPPLRNWGSWSGPSRRPPAYEAGALPTELQERIAGAGFEPAPDTAYEAAALPLSYPAAPCRRRDLNPHGPCPRRSERRASAVSPRRRVPGNGSGGSRTRCALGFNQPLYR